MVNELQLFWIMAVPVVIFLAFVAPTWIVFHYLTRWKQMKHVSLDEGYVAVERSELLRLRDTASRLEARMGALESILDDASPGWRKR